MAELNEHKQSKQKWDLNKGKDYNQNQNRVRTTGRPYLSTKLVCASRSITAVDTHSCK